MGTKRKSDPMLIPKTEVSAMKRLFPGLLLCAVLTFIPTALFSGTPSAVEASYSKLPLSFVKNEGQTDKNILFYEQGSGRTTVFSLNGVALRLARSGKVKEPVSAGEVTLTFPGVTPSKVEPLERRGGKVNYFIGKEPRGWKTDVPTYGAILYKDVFPGTDIKFYGSNRQLEYDIIVAPGSDPSRVVLSYKGAKKLALIHNGDLEISLENGSILQKKPILYQTIDGKREYIPGNFVIKEGTAYGFEAASYDKAKPLIIDPVLLYSTYLGGSAYDTPSAITLDSAGNIYVVGGTWSSDFPLQNPYQQYHRGPRPDLSRSDVFVTKFDPLGASLIYSTYLGGEASDFGNAIAVDSEGNAYVAGFTYSSNFPSKNSLQQPYANGETGDGFVTKLGPEGNSLVYSTFLGGTAHDAVLSLALAPSGSVYVTGITSSTDFPTIGPYQTSNAGLQDGFVAKINAAGDALVYSTYFGGNKDDNAWCIAIDSSGNAYVTGWTESPDFPTFNPFQKSLRGFADAFVAKFGPAGDALVYSTYLGGKSGEQAYTIALDSAGCAYVGGATGSTDFPKVNAYQRRLKATQNGFVTKISQTGTTLIYSTYLGANYDAVYGITVDSSGNAYVAGQTWSEKFPVKNPVQGYGGNWDGFVSKLNSSGDTLVYSTYLGGSQKDIAYAVTVDASGTAYVAGETCSTDFPILNPYQATLSKDSWKADVFVVKLSPQTLPTLTVSKSGNGAGTVASSLPSGIDCGAACSASYGAGTKVYLTPTPSKGSVFTGWTQGCAGDNICALVVSEDVTVDAGFDIGSCSYALSSGNKQLAHKGGVITLGVKASQHNFCTTPDIEINNTDSEWVACHASGLTNNKGSAKISVLSNNSSKSRTGTVLIGGMPFTVSQSGAPCGFTLSSTSSGGPVSGTGATGNFTVTTTAIDCPWTAAPDTKSSWLSVDSGGNGTSTLNYTAAPNNTGRPRTGRIVVKVNKTSKSYTVRQEK